MFRITLLLVLRAKNDFLDNIRVFSCHCFFNIATLLKAVRLFPDVEWVEIPASASVLVVLGGLCTISMDIRKLRGIRFACDGLPFSPPTFLKDYFSTLASLQFVEFRGEVGCFQRWYRGSNVPVEIRWKSSGGTEWLSDWMKDVVEVESEEPLPELLF